MITFEDYNGKVYNFIIHKNYIHVKEMPHAFFHYKCVLNGGSYLYRFNLNLSNEFINFVQKLARQIKDNEIFI